MKMGSHESIPTQTIRFFLILLNLKEFKNPIIIPILYKKKLVPDKLYDLNMT